MKLQRRVRRRGDVITITQRMTFTQSEYDLVQKVCDDDNVTMDTIMSPDDGVSTSFFSILWYWLMILPTLSKEDIVRMAIYRKRCDEMRASHKRRNRETKNRKNKRVPNNRN